MQPVQLREVPVALVALVALWGAEEEAGAVAPMVQIRVQAVRVEMDMQ